jgi:hypothetical protein
MVVSDACLSPEKHLPLSPGFLKQSFHWSKYFYDCRICQGNSLLGLEVKTQFFLSFILRIEH